MDVLEILTLACAFAFVGLLGPALWRIYRQLLILRNALLEVRAALGSIREETAPLNRHLLRLQVAASGSERALIDAERGLEHARERLASLTEQEIVMETAY